MKKYVSVSVLVEIPQELAHKNITKTLFRDKRVKIVGATKNYYDVVRNNRLQSMSLYDRIFNWLS